MRAFIAAEIPEELKNRLSEAASFIDFPEVKRVDKRKIHLTIAFLDGLREDEVESVKGIIDNSGFAGFDLELSGIACFGNPGAIYAAVGDGFDNVSRIAASIRSGLRDAGIHFDSKKFVPHVTIAKVKRPMDEDSLKEVINRFRNKRFGKFRLNTISIFRSTLAPDGAVYEKLYERKR